MDTKKRKITFDFGKETPEKKEEKKEDVEKKVDAVIEPKDPSSPEELARRYEEVLLDPPVKDYGKVELYRAEDKEGNTCLAMPVEDGEVTGEFEDGSEVKVTLYEPLFEIDLYTLYQGQLSETPINVIPNLIDEKVQIELGEKQIYKPEKVKKDWTQWYWIIVAASFIPMIIIGIAIISGMW